MTENPFGVQGPTEDSHRPAEDDSAFESYQKVAETVGMLPSLRWKDNLIQAAVVAGTAFVSAAIGYLIWGLPGAAGLGFCGLLAGLLISGIVLMVLGWRRAAR